MEAVSIHYNYLLGDSHSLSVLESTEAKCFLTGEENTSREGVSNVKRRKSFLLIDSDEIFVAYAFLVASMSPKAKSREAIPLKERPVLGMGMSERWTFLPEGFAEKN